jgi:hypothetical protein
MEINNKTIEQKYDDFFYAFEALNQFFDAHKKNDELQKDLYFIRFSELVRELSPYYLRLLFEKLCDRV